MTVLSFIKSVIRRISKVLLLDFEIPLLYRASSRKAINENKVVFIEVRHNYITDSFSLLYNRLINDGEHEVKACFLRNVELHGMAYRKRVYEMVKEIADAKYIFINDGCNAVAAVPLRKESRLIQTWHACGAFKKFGCSTAKLKFGESSLEQRLHPNYKNISLVSVSAPDVVWAYEEAMNIQQKGVVKPLGVSRTDVFYDSEFINSAKAEITEKYPKTKGKKLILYAPTYRGRVAEAAPADKLDIKQFYERLGGEYALLIKQHPLVKNRPPVPEEYSDFAFDVADSVSIDSLLCAADICITDYSSVIFEYSIFEKPMIFFVYDIEDYYDWRGFYFSFDELAPGLQAKTNEEMLDYIEHLDERFDKQAVKDFRNRFMSACDGKSTERILSYIFSNK